VLGITDTSNKSLRVIADHLRSTAFLIVDGVIPSNEGRGYVLRRIIRRAIRHGYQSGHKDPFMHLLVDSLVNEMGDAFPELRQASDKVKRVLKQENEKFNETLDQGLKILDQEIKNMSGGTIPGAVVFKLYDTYGFPADLTADVAREHDLEIHSAEFEQAMEAQRQRARSASQFTQGDQIKIDGLEKTPFVGYQALEYDVKTVALVKDGSTVDRLESGDQGVVVLVETPFYAESGGQVGDRGIISFSGGEFRVTDTQYLANKVIGHFGSVESGELTLDQSALANVEPEGRYASANNHSATHLLHAALRQVLGDHVEQKGSLVEPRRLRFDFSHFEPVSDPQAIQIEALVNDNIRENHAVTVEIMDLDQARAAGAAALFGEKYDESVRVVRMGEFSFELCGGTHVVRTGDIGFFKLISESGIAAGVRRIEAITGAAAGEHVNDQAGLLVQLAATLKTTPDRIGERVAALVDVQKQQQKQIQSLQAKLAAGGSADDLVREVNGVKVVAIRQDDSDVKSMRMAVDQWRNKLQSGVVLVAGANNGKVTLIAGISKDLNDRLKAGELIGELSPLVNGKGGGRPDLAQGGGSNVEGIGPAMEAAYTWVKENL
jgi:alanyl-tRNA synthetase